MNGVAIITGAGKGIGQATAMALAHRGWTPVLVSRTESDLKRTADAIDGPSLAITADITEAEALRRVVEETTTKLGRLDAVVNNAGLAPLRPFEEINDDILRQVLEVNLVAAFILSRHAWPHLKKHGGTIVNLSSLSATDPFPGFSAYAAAKAGLHGLTIALAKEGAEHGIRCVGIAPAGVETTMFRALPGMADVPGEALLTSDEVASVIVDCITGPLRYATGEVVQLRKTR